MELEVRLVVSTERTPAEVLEELVYYLALRPSKRIDVEAGLVLRGKEEAARYERGGEVR